MYLLKLLLAPLALVGGILLAVTVWQHPWWLLIGATAIAAVWPWHKRWQQRDAAHQTAQRR